MIGKKVTLELRRKTETDDGMGNVTTTWAGLRNITGVLSTIRGAERLSADKLTVIADFNFCIDFTIGVTITEEDIFQWGIRELKITFIADIGANQNQRLRITLLEEK